MPRKPFAYLVMLCALLFAPAQAQTPLPPLPLGEDPVAFTVLAEPQLALPLTEITRLYSLHRRVSLLTAFEDSRTQFNKLLEGESGDVIVTSLPTVSTELKQRGMIDVYSQASIATDALVLATANQEVKNRRQLIDSLRHVPVLLANGDRYVEGIYGSETLRYLFYDNPAPELPRRFNSRDGLYDALRAQEGVAILLQSEAQRLDGISLTVPLADTSYPPVVYHGMAIAGENMQLARDFIEFLKTSEAQAIFARYGFNPR